MSDKISRIAYRGLPQSTAFRQLLERALGAVFNDGAWEIKGAELFITSNSDNDFVDASTLATAVIAIYNGGAGEFICTHKIQAHGLIFYGRPVNEIEGNSAAEFDCVEAYCINGKGVDPCSVNRTRFNNGHIVTTLSIPKIVKLAA
jgi:hypothetical protein